MKNKTEENLLRNSIGEILLIIGAVAIGKHINFVVKKGFEGWIIFIGGCIVFLGVALKIMPTLYLFSL